MGRAPALSAALCPGAAAIDQAFATACEQYVRRHPRSLAAHIISLAAAESGELPDVLPFPLVVVPQADGRIMTADGDILIDCRGGLVIAAVEAAAPMGSRVRKLRTLFHLDLLAAGLLVGEDAGLTVPNAAAEAARLRDAIDAFKARRNGWRA